MPIALRFAARSNLGLGSKTRNEDSAFASPTCSSSPTAWADTPPATPRARPSSPN